MNRLKHLIAPLITLSLVWSLIPSTGLAHALGEDDEVIVLDRSKATEDHISDVEEGIAQEQGTHEATDDEWDVDVVFREDMEPGWQPDLGDGEAPTSDEDTDEPETTDLVTTADETPVLSGYATGTFSDVDDAHWARSIIELTAALGIMTGYSGDKAGMFGPDDTISRGQAVVTLWRLANKPSVTSAKSFTDVDSAAYYAPAVAWATSTGVASGYSGNREGLFGPNDPVTREQLAVMLCNYAQRVAHIKISYNEGAYIAASDASSVSGWATNAIAWCFGAGLLTGSNGKVKPQNNATRAEAAKMLLALYRRAASNWQLSITGGGTYARKGTTISVVPTITGGPVDTSISYTVSLGSWTGKISSGEITLNKVGRYSITVTARAASGRVQQATTTVFSYGGIAKLTSSRASDRNFNLTGNAGFGDGVGVTGVEYRFTWKRGGASGTLQDWSPKLTAKLNPAALGDQLGTYVVTVEARDAAGTITGTAKTTVTNSSGDAQLDSYLRDIYKNVTGTDSNALRKGYDYVRLRFSYTHANVYPSGGWRSWSIGYAKEMYRNRIGNCYRYASLMCWIARGLGYDAWVVSGELMGYTRWVAHGWVELKIDGKTYIIDCEMAHEYPQYNYFLTTFNTAPSYYRYL